MAAKNERLCTVFLHDVQQNNCRLLLQANYVACLPILQIYMYSTNFTYILLQNKLLLELNESLFNRQRGSVPSLISGMVRFLPDGTTTVHTCCIIVITFTSKQWLWQSKESSSTISENKNHWITHLYKLNVSSTENMFTKLQLVTLVLHVATFNFMQ